MKKADTVDFSIDSCSTIYDTSGFVSSQRFIIDVSINIQLEQKIL